MRESGLARHRAPHKDRHTPRKRSIQYAAAFRFHHWRLGILDRPLSRAMTAGGVARSHSTNCLGFNFQTAVVARKHSFANATLQSRGAMRPRFAFISRPMEGVGNAGCPLHPRPRVHFVLVERTRATTSTPESPGIPARNGFTAYVVLSPVTGLFCHRRLRIKFCLSPVGPTQLRKLDASVGASGPHDFAVRNNISRQHAGESLKSLSTRPAIPSRAKRCRVHRNPSRVRDDHDTPLLWGGMPEVLEVIWGEWEQKYFSEKQK